MTGIHSTSSSDTCSTAGCSACSPHKFVGKNTTVDISSRKTEILFLDLYQLAFSDDKLLIKCLVYSIYAIETAQTALLISNAFRIFGSGFADPRALNNIGTIWISIGILGPISM